MQSRQGRIIIYQALARLFGNVRKTGKPNGSIEQNGCGKFSSFSEMALAGIRELGVTHIWYTGVIEHASVTDYSKYGIPGGYAEIIKGVAGSPFAIRDYFDVNPDLAEDVDKRMDEFIAMIDRTHQAGLKAIIDFVPNHLSRDYQSDSMPAEFEDFGIHDDKTVEFSPRNDFYYLPGETLTLPGKALEIAKILQDKEKKGWYHEHPARATGNDVFSSHPQITDWYETVKLNYGVNFQNNHTRHFDPIPPLWFKMLHVLQFWSEKGVDGFRVDMAEMIPVEFWQWVIPAIKKDYPDKLFVAEIYKPNHYKSFIQSGFDLLYDKEGFYETVRNVLTEKLPAKEISTIWQRLENLEPHMLRFLENHDEERIASPAFLGDPWKAIPGILLALSMNKSAVMIYFGQEVGEPAEGESGFSGNDGKTTIFDYWHVPEHQKWIHEGQFDGKKLSSGQKALREFYTSAINFFQQQQAIQRGEFYDLMWANEDRDWFRNGRVYAFLRYDHKQKLLIVLNFDSSNSIEVSLNIPEHAYSAMGVNHSSPMTMSEVYPNSQPLAISVTTAVAEFNVLIPPSMGKVFELSISENKTDRFDIQADSD